MCVATVSPQEATIKQYFSGIAVQEIRNRIKGFVKIKYNTPFSVIKWKDRL